MTDITHHSFWLDQLAPAPTLPDMPLASVDVVIIGSGYTGLNAALELARGGRQVMVIDAEDPGHGCSTRNGGQIGSGIKADLAQLSARLGTARAQAILDEDSAAQDWIEQRIIDEGIACDYKRNGRFHAAHTPQHYEMLARNLTKTKRGSTAHMVPRADQRSELGTDSYYGGAVYPRDASLHAGKYHRGLLNAAIAAGVHIVGHCAATDITRNGKTFTVQTFKGPVQARNVIVATNGYTTGLTPWLQRRVIPIGSYIIATEPLAPGMIDTLFPTDRMVSDTCKVVYYYRASPDRQRVLFGGRVSAGETTTGASAGPLFDSMCRIFPELRGTKISHSWHGTVAYTFDELPHIGTHDGVHYAMGYCGVGVMMGSYLGMRLGQQVLGLPEGRTAFDGLNHPMRPFYRGKPWFLPAAVAWYRWKDAREIRRAATAHGG
ncbi:FAD-binding oxidoreductase [Rhodobacteraceae bacterium KMM 6894]|nr:FAD-binding oxidoreductase [Rhodobacteraceae bacterium KMM 6894]